MKGVCDICGEEMVLSRLLEIGGEYFCPNCPGAPHEVYPSESVEDVLCPCCNGSGDGQQAGTVCWSCRGTGEAR